MNEPEIEFLDEPPITADPGPVPGMPPVEPERTSAGPVAAWAARVLAEVNKVYVGQDDLVRGVLAALLADGHVLIESVPGLGKTLLVRALGRVLGCGFNRIQFTPDLMPSDVTGSPVYDERQHDFRFRPGPVFTQLLLADEINRAPAKTHSALLEIMQEYRVTVDGTSHPIERPFLVLATQNPIESEGTYNLPEAQLDRFLFKLVAGYPSALEETNILRLHTQGSSPDALLATDLVTVTNPEEVLKVQARCASVLVDDRILNYIAALVRKTREWPTFSLGASPRAGVAILRGARAVAALEGRDFAVPDDVQEVAPWALRHRVMLTPEAEVEGQSADDLLAELIRSVEVPRS
jgi:MoxR-like ATPase